MCSPREATLRKAPCASASYFASCLANTWSLENRGSPPSKNEHTQPRGWKQWCNAVKGAHAARLKGPEMELSCHEPRLRWQNLHPVSLNLARATRRWDSQRDTIQSVLFYSVLNSKGEFGTAAWQEKSFYKERLPLLAQTTFCISSVWWHFCCTSNNKCPDSVCHVKIVTLNTAHGHEVMQAQLARERIIWSNLKCGLSFLVVWTALPDRLTPVYSLKTRWLCSDDWVIRLLLREKCSKIQKRLS